MRRRLEQRGNAMIETALALTVFFMLLFGIVEIGRAIWMRSTMTYLSHEGARWASVRGGASDAPVTPAEVEAYVKRIAVGVDHSALVVKTSFVPDNRPGSAVQVQVEYPFSYLVPFLPSGRIGLIGTAQLIITQ